MCARVKNSCLVFAVRGCDSDGGGVCVCYESTRFARDHKIHNDIQTRIGIITTTILLLSFSFSFSCSFMCIFSHISRKKTLDYNVLKNTQDTQKISKYSIALTKSAKENETHRAIIHFALIQTHYTCLNVRVELNKVIFNAN